LTATQLQSIHSLISSLKIEIGVGTQLQSSFCQDIMGPIPSVFLDKWGKYKKVCDLKN
jgi:hypothetical protein